MIDTMSTVILVAIGAALVIYMVTRRPSGPRANSRDGGAGDYTGSDDSDFDGGSDGGGDGGGGD